MRTMRRFGANTSGSTAILFGLTLLPLMGAVGAAVDYSRAASFHSRAQLAVDGAALAIVREPDTLSAAEISKKGEDYVMAALSHAADPKNRVTLDAVTATRQGKTVKVRVAATMKPAIMQVLGISAMPVAADAEATWGNPNATGQIEIALVLDNTGSMGRNIDGKQKIEELRSASASLLNKLRQYATQPDKVKVSIVPFATEVRLDRGLRNEKWFRWNDPVRDPAQWGGHVVDRYGNYAVSDAAANTAVQDSLFPPVLNPASPKLATLRPLASLDNQGNYDAIASVISQMQPSGNTNITIGVNWGLATLSSGAPFSNGAPRGTPKVKKFMIVLTDGYNTEHHVNGLSKNYKERYAAPMDKLTSAACEMVKREDIDVYTVRMLEGDDNLLRNCASTPGNYFDVQKAGELASVFDVIFNAITDTRLTH